jgi:CHAT domain-containing protein/Flp pilus assembly protein TadD
MRYGKSIVLAGLVMGLVSPVVLGAGPSIAQVQAQTTEQKKAEADRLLQQGIQQFKVSQHQEALQSWQKALSIYHEIQDHSGEGVVLGNLGIIYNALGFYAKAINCHEISLAIARKLNDQDREGIALANLGIVYEDLGKYDKAIEYHEMAVAIAHKFKKLFREGQSLANLSNTYIAKGRSLANLGKTDAAFHMYKRAADYGQQSVAISHKINNQYGESGSLDSLGILYNYLGDYTKAINSHQQSLEIKRKIKDRIGEGNALGNLGVAYESLGDYAKAINYYQQSLVIQHEIGDRGGEGNTFHNVGNALRNQGQTDLAIVFYKQSVNLREEIRAGLNSLSHDLQESYTQSVAGTYRTLADLLLSQGRVLEAQQVLELLKIQELRDYTKDTRAGSDTTQGSPLIPLEQPIPAAFNDKMALGNQLTQCEQTKCAQRPQLIAQVGEANKKFSEVVDRLKKSLRNGEITDPEQLQSNKFTLAAQKVILANPNTKTVLVYPLVLDDKLWLVWGSQAGDRVIFQSKAVPVNRRDLSEKVVQLQTLLSKSGDPKELQQVSHQLYQWLIEPIRQQLDDNGIKQIVFSLDRATRYIPMSTLHDGKQYLIENFAISTILTADTIDNHDKLSPNKTENPVLGLGLTQEVPGFKALTAVKAEINSIVKQPKNTTGLYPGRALFDRDFTETVLDNISSSYRIIHIATHGQFIPGKPDDSFLVMGDGNHLSINSIGVKGNFNKTHLVVLSACETGKGGPDSEGLEVSGIGNAFLLGGAKSVMVSLWQVNDPATSLLMQQFYKNLATGTMSKAEALRQAQIAFLTGKLTTKNTEALDRAGARRHIAGQLPIDSLAHPYYWAPFILIGNSQ